MCFPVNINRSFASSVSRLSKYDGYIIHRKLAVNHCIDSDMKTHQVLFFVFFLTFGQQPGCVWLLPIGRCEPKPTIKVGINFICAW